MNLTAQLVLGLLVLWVPLAVVFGARKVSLRLGLLLAAAFYANGLWQAYPAAHGTVVGWLVVVVAGLVFIRGRGRGRGSARGRVAGGGRGQPVVPRQGGGLVVGPRPFNAGGPPAVVVVAQRGLRAGRGVARSVGRGRRRLEVVGGTAVENVREGRVPWHRRVRVKYVEAGAWLETVMRQRNRVRNGRAVDELRAGVEGQPGSVGVWLPGERPRPWLADVDRLHRDVDGRRP